MRRALLVLLLVLAPAGPAAARPVVDEKPRAAPASRAVGKPYAGRLIDGVRFAAEGFDFVTWDPIRRRTPNRAWRRWATQEVIDSTLFVLREYRDANPGAPRVLVGDLSRAGGGPFGPRYGGLGHASHQNGLDVDIYYPRLDRRPVEASVPSDVDPRLAQDLVDRFVRAGAVKIYTGPNLRLRGPRRVVQKLVHHDDHLHVRFRTE